MRVQVYHTPDHPDQSAMVKVGGRVVHFEVDDDGEVKLDKHNNPIEVVVSDEPETLVRADESGHIREGQTSFSYRVGRIQDTHNPLTFEQITRDQIAKAYLERARLEFPPPHYEVRLERFVDDVARIIDPETGEHVLHPETGEPQVESVGRWVPYEDGDELAAPGKVIDRTLDVSMNAPVAGSEAR